MASVAAVSPSTPINNAETITSSSSPLIKPKEEIDDAPLDTSSELINTKEENASQDEFATTLVSTIENYQQLRRQGRLSITSISNLINHNDGNNSEEASQTNGSDHRKRKQLDSSGENEIDGVDENTSTSDHASAETLLSLFKRRRVSISEAAQDINSDQDEHENAYKDNNFGCATNNNKTNDNDEDELAQPPSPVPSFDDTPLIDDSVSDDMSNAATIISKMSSTVSSNHPMHGPNGNGGSVGGIILPPSNFSGKQTRKKPYIPRPPNSFILYRQHHHPIILNQHPGINNSEISRIIADHWKNLSDEEKQEWRRKAEEAKEHHMKAYPDYKYQPRRRAGPHTTFRKANIHIQNLAMEEQGKFVDNHFVIEKLPPSQQSNANEEDHEVPRTDVYSSSMEDVRMINNDNRSASRFIKHEVKGRNVVIIEGGSKELSRIARTRATPAEALKSKLQPRTPSALLTSATTSRILHPLGQAPSPTSSPPNFFPRSSQPQPHTPTRLPPLIPPNVSTSSTSSPTSPGTPITTRGAMIVLEGCEDGSTALQAGKLHDFLKNEGIEAKLWKFPDHTTPAGNALKSYQQSNRQPHPKTLHLLIAAHWWELMPIMKDHLLSGTTLIVDRYVYSAIAASAAAGLELNWCKASYVHLLSPDLIFFLSVSGVDREANPASVNGGSEGGADQGRSNVEWQRRMQDAFLRLAEVQWKLLDASKSSTLVHTQITQASIEVIERCRKCNTSYGTTGNNNILPLHQSPPGASSSAANISSPQKVSNQSQQQQLLPPPLGRHEGFARPVHVQL